MQWIFLLVGLVLGWVFDESFSGALLGSLAGLGLGLALRMGQLNRRLDNTQQLLASVQQRLDQQPQLPLSPPESSSPIPEPKPEPPLLEETEDLTWDLPGEDDWLKPGSPAARPFEPALSAPAVQDVFEQAFNTAQQWLLGGNTVLRIGVVLLFLGLAFLLRYATEGVVVSVEVRYAGVAAVALALLGLGWWLRTRNANYALILQGTGVGVLYLTIFAAMRLHTLIDPSVAFGLLVAITVFSGILAVTQDSLGLAAAAALGGFAAPILTSTGAGSHIALFSYFTLLNAGIFAIAWFKTWRLLNLIGFVGTFGIGFAWGLRAYTSELFLSTELFLVLFFLMYLAIGLLFARRKLRELATAPEDASREAMLHWSARQGDYVDGSILFGPPIVGLCLQFALVQPFEFGAAYSALALGLLYIGIAKLLAGRTPGRALLLVETCLALGVVFGSLAIPLGLDAQWTSAAWAVEGAAIFWLGLRQQRTLARVFGLLLQFGAGAALLGIWQNIYDGNSYSNVATGDFWTPLIVALAALVSASMLSQLTLAQTVNTRRLGNSLLAWAVFWWAVALLDGVQRFAPTELRISWLLLLGAFSVAMWTVAAVRLRWSGLAVLCTLLMPCSCVVLLAALGWNSHPFAHWGWLAWAAIAAVHGISLRRLADLLPQWAVNAAHVIGCWLIICVLALELRFGFMQLSEHYNAWRWLGWALLPTAYLLLMAAPRTLPWPIERYSRQYRVWAAAPLAVLMLLWFWLANFFSDGAADPLPYIPLINPLELGLLFALAGVFTWMRGQMVQLGVTPAVAQRNAQLVAGISLFALVTAMVMRTVHHWNGVPFEMSDLMASMRVQAALSIVWTLMALTLMVGGNLRGRREIWIAGAVLIGVVVAKLFFVELSDRGGLERIISFIGVGVLLLVVGYFSPLPPKPVQAAVS